MILVRFQQSNAVPYTERAPQLVSQADISQAALLVCFEKADYAALEKQFDCSGLVSWTVPHKLLHCLQVSHQLLGYFHPNGPLDIPDPLHFSDPKGYEKCYWMVYKSMRGLVKFLKEEEEAEARRRPKVIKLADPTIFTITRYHLR